MKRWSRVEVEWNDSVNSSGWCSTKDHTDVRTDCYTLGYWFGETDEVIKVVQSYGHRETDHEEYNNLMTIPKVCVIKIRRLG